jgi:hypothetical protein
MTRWKLRAALVASLLGGATLLPACANFEPPRTQAGGFAIVSGYRSNMPPPSIAGKARQWLGEAALAGDELFIVGVDGHPEELLHKTFQPECGRVQAACEGFRDGQVDDIDQRIRSQAARADDPEADTLEAIIIAARRLSAIDGPKHIVVIDNGMQTTGVLPMSTPWAFRADPESVIKPLREDERLRTLEGVDVLFSGLGSHASPQGRLDDGDVATLEKLWRGILGALGANVETDTVTLSGELPPDLPPVKVIVKEDNQIPPTPCVRLREDQVGFRPGSPVLINAARTRDVFRPIAEQLEKTGVVTTLIGTTALDDGPGHKLSNARAVTAKRVMMDLGVPARQLITVGVGINFAGYQDPYVKGVFSEIIAIGNRLVIVQPAGQTC